MMLTLFYYDKKVRKLRLHEVTIRSTLKNRAIESISAVKDHVHEFNTILLHISLIIAQVIRRTI